MDTRDIQASLLLKLHDRESIIAQAKLWKEDDISIGFTNGVFDILHVGHVNYLTEAAAHCDVLIIGLNDDASVKRLGKGPERPINSEVARALVLAGLDAVAAVSSFGEDTPLDLIKAILPDVLMKGGDYDANCEDETDKAYIVGSKEVKAAGGEVLSIPFVKGFSTTSTLKKLQG